MSCKDCIHYNICLDNGDDAAKQNAPNAEKECEDFKNKADFVEVVRCKDCKYFRQSKCIKTNGMVSLSADNFCSYGERR